MTGEKTIEDGSTIQNVDVPDVLEWKEPAKDEEEERRRKVIGAYARWMVSEPKFKKILLEEFEKVL